MYPAMAFAMSIWFDIDKCSFLAAPAMILQWRFSFFKRRTLPENCCVFGSFTRYPGSLPANIHTLVHQWPSEIHVIKQHMRGRRIPGVDNLIIHMDSGLAQPT